MRAIVAAGYQFRGGTPPGLGGFPRRAAGRKMKSAGDVCPCLPTRLGVTSTCTVVEVEGRAVCLPRAELQPRKAASGLLWGWNEDGHRTELELGYSVEGVSPARRDVCVQSIRRWGGSEYGIHIRRSEKPPGVERTFVFTESHLRNPRSPWEPRSFPGPEAPRAASGSTRTQTGRGTACCTCWCMRWGTHWVFRTRTTRTR